MTYSSWSNHQYFAQNSAEKKLKKRPKMGKKYLLSQEEIQELEHIFKTAPPVLKTMHLWQTHSPLTQKDKQALLKAERLFLQKMLLPKEASSLVYKTPYYWTHWGWTAFVLALFVLGNLTLLMHFKSIQMPWWGGLLLDYLGISMIYKQINLIRKAKAPQAQEQSYRLELTQLAQQKLPFAQMIQEQIRQGFEPSYRQWKQIFYWKNHVLDLTTIINP